MASSRAGLTWQQRVDALLAEEPASARCLGALCVSVLCVLCDYVLVCGVRYGGRAGTVTDDDQRAC